MLTPKQTKKPQSTRGIAQFRTNILAKVRRII